MDTTQEQALRAQLESDTRSYSEGLERLKQLKAEIEHLQHLLQTAKVSGHHELGERQRKP